VRRTANGLAVMGGAMDAAGAGFGQAPAASDSSWLGAAGEAFRSRIGTARRTTTAAASAPAHRSATTGAQR
jgi:hypothetical protein